MLRDYQIEIGKKAVEILRSYGLVYLCMEVRTGKTRTALHTADLYGAQRVLFLTKKKAIASIKTDMDALSPAFTLYVANYESAHKIDPDDFDFVILDEAHCLGAFPAPASRTKVVKKICDLKPIIYLSGTPSPESFSQVFHQFYVSCNSPFKQYKNFYAWAKDYVTVKKRYFYNREVNDYSKADHAKIEAATGHLFISYTQEEAGFTQMVQEHVIKVKMQPRTYTLASTMRARRVYIGQNGSEVIADTEVKLMQKLHQIYSGTVIADNNGEAQCFDDTKARFILEHFAGKKIAIFYKFKAELALLKWAFKGLVTESPEEFNQRQDLVFLSQIQSGREGINLSTADCLVMFNIDFSHVSYLQARARLQTKDRQKACELYWIFSEDGIEEKIYERVQNKQDYQIAYFRRDFNVQPIKKTA